jgi:hypothetical protein
MLAPAELQALLRELDKRERVLVLLAGSSGMRRGPTRRSLLTKPKTMTNQDYSPQVVFSPEISRPFLIEESNQAAGVKPSRPKRRILMHLNPEIRSLFRQIVEMGSRGPK